MLGSEGRASSQPRSARPRAFRRESGGAPTCDAHRPAALHGTSGGCGFAPASGSAPVSLPLPPRARWETGGSRCPKLPLGILPTMTRPTVQLDHCVVHVSDWDRSNAFYRDVLGAELI